MEFMDTTQHMNPLHPVFADCDGTCQGVCADPDYVTRTNHNASAKRMAEALAIPDAFTDRFLCSDNTPLTAEGKFAESSRRGILAKLFEQVLEIAGGTVKHYRSDFFHDALWLDIQLDRPCTFLLDFDDCGTWLWMADNPATPPPTRTHRWELTVRRGQRTDDDGAIRFNHEWVLDARPLAVK